MGSDSAAGVRVNAIQRRHPGRRVRDPMNPMADAEGYVTHANVNAVEMVNMISASRSYQNNVEVMNTAKSLLLKTCRWASKAGRTNMNISPSTPARWTAAPTPPVQDARLIDRPASAMQDRFWKLLVAQLNNQDPMNPLDNAQMTTQMAQINTVTGLQTLNQTMQTMAEQFSTMQQIQGISLIGRSVLSGATPWPGRQDRQGRISTWPAPPAASRWRSSRPAAWLVDTIDMGAQGGRAAEL